MFFRVVSPDLQVTLRGEQALAAVWSEKAQVEIFDLRSQVDAVHSSAAMSAFIKQQKEATPLFSFSGHMTEGFAIDWSPKVPGELDRSQTVTFARCLHANKMTLKWQYNFRDNSLCRPCFVCALSIIPNK